MQNLPPNLPTLPMHLALTLGYTLSWPIALQCANAGLLPLKKLPPEMLAKKPLAENLHREAKKRASDFLKGVQRFTEIPFTRDMPEPSCIWQKGNAKILDYGLSPHPTPLPRAGEGSKAKPKRKRENLPVVLFIPSLINRYYILDLEKERSLLRFLATQGIYPLVMDWGIPGDEEANYCVSDYITEILLPAIDFIARTSGEKVALGGYCMGGVLALAAAQLRPSKVDKLALFATPWNFHCQAFSPFILDSKWQEKISEMLSSEEQVPASIIQSLFYLTDPFVFEDKFRRFLALDSNSRAAKDFIALEHWVNDGVPMTSGVAKDCLIGWSQQNVLARGEWKVSGKKIDPKKIKQEVFIAIPKQDHVVPEDCANALAEQFPKATTIQPSSGHVGMIVGSRAKSECWIPLTEWLLHRSK